MTRMNLERRLSLHCHNQVTLDPTPTSLTGNVLFRGMTWAHMITSLWVQHISHPKLFLNLWPICTLPLKQKPGL